METRILESKAVAPMVHSLLDDYARQQGVVIGPQAKGPQFVFAPISDPNELRMDYDTSILPPRMVLQPPYEQIAVFHLGDEPWVEPVIEARPTVILGVHTCDLQAFRLLDRAFTGNYLDEHYLERRRQTRVISLECLQPCDEYSFCKDMGTLTADEGFDLHLTGLGDAYVVQIGTEAGKELLDKHAETRPATDTDIRSLSHVLSAKWPRFTNRLRFSADALPSLLDTAYDHPLWDELGERCLSCGTCTIVCPTCFCFNMMDSISLDQTEAVRTRCWDSCQLDGFARVAGGESFREARAARQRHRFFRKGKWLREQYSALGCVGCGRCIRTCLVHINIVDCLNSLFGREAAYYRPR
jgi:sulfhydrogenase subunit beta (sulfur reductase)